MTVAKYVFYPCIAGFGCFVPAFWHLQPFTQKRSSYTPNFIYLKMAANINVRFVIKVLLVVLLISINGFVFFGFQHQVNWSDATKGAGNQNLLLLVFAIHIALQLVFGYVLLYKVFSRSQPLKKGAKLIVTLTGLLLLFYIADNIITGHFLAIVYHHKTVFAHSPRWIISFVLYAFTLIIAVSYRLGARAYAGEKQKQLLIENQLSTELNFLKAQIDPHFLFNSLNNLFFLAQQQNNAALMNGIAKLSDLMKFSLYETNRPFIELEKEIEYIKNFIGLAQLRYKEKEIETSLTITGDVKGVCIAPMIFLPFVENAFKYSFDFENPSYINIQINVDNKIVLFTCKNRANTALKQPSASAKGVGLKNVKRRLELIYGNSHTLTLQEKEEVFTVHLQINTDDKLHYN